ncbi:MAG: Holliday junction resolvase RuvX [Candidatus Omnitrophota bacterium]
MKILAVDFGMRRIGFAIGNPLIHTITPIDPLIRKNSKQAVDHIRQLVDTYEITHVIVGYPLNMDGTRSSFTEQVEHFTQRLKKRLGPDIPIDFIDERLSSFEAEEELKTHPMGNIDHRKKKKMLDSMSAQVLLKRFMEIT